jgi:hypothetical protein
MPSAAINLEEMQTKQELDEEEGFQKMIRRNF